MNSFESFSESTVFSNHLATNTVNKHTITIRIFSLKLKSFFFVSTYLKLKFLDCVECQETKKKKNTDQSKVEKQGLSSCSRYVWHM